MPAARISKVSIQTARIQTGRIQNGLRRTVHMQIDHIRIGRTPTGRTLTGPRRRDLDSTARQGRVGERDVQARRVEGFSLLRAVVLLIAEVLVAQKNRGTSLSAATLPTSSR
jgi:hypothetical protein